MRKPYFKFSGAIVLAALILGTGLVLAQSDISVSVEDINTEAFPQTDVFVAATNAQGLPVENLTKENFSVLEDGIPVDNFEVSLTQNTQQGISFILAMDTSGTMRMDGTPTRLDNAVGAATAFVENLSDKDQVGLITFGEEVRIVQGLTTDHTLVTNSLKDLEALKNTYLYDGLMAALKELEAVQSRRVIILITDGVDSNASDAILRDDEEVLSLAIKNSTPIFVLGFGDVNEKQLTRMATLTGGSAQINPTSNDLEVGFEDILKILREQYLISYQSALPAKNQGHTISVSLNYLDETYTSEKEFTIDTAPRISINFDSPIAGDSLSGSQDIAVSVDSKFPIEQLTISVDGEVLNTFTAPPYSFHWELYNVKNGDHIIRVEATDDQGLTQTQEMTVTVSQVISGEGTDNPFSGLGLYLVFAAFAVLLVVIIAFGIRKRKEQEIVDEAPLASSSTISTLVELQGRNPNKIWSLSAPEVRLGRKSDVNDIPLQGTKASRQMALIQNRQGQHIIRSVKPENPVILNGTPIEQEMPLNNGDIITLGESVFRYDNQSNLQ